MMRGMSGLPRALIVAGVVLGIVGLVLHFVPSAGQLGRLPGDLRIERGGVRVYVPITTCILLSVCFSAAMWFLSRFFG